MQKIVNRQLPHIFFAIMLTLSWPIIVWLGITYSQFHWSLLLWALLFLLQLFVLKGHVSVLATVGKILVLPAVVLCSVSSLLRDYQLLLYYPVLVNGLMLLLFGRSLFYGMSLVEQFARLREPNLPVTAVHYTWCVTWVWCLFFIFNGGMALAACLYGDIRLWALWNGMVSYLLMALLMVTEWLVRQCVRKLT